MMKTRHTEITIETHEVTLIRRNGKQIKAFCQNCQSEVFAFEVTMPGPPDGNDRAHLRQIANEVTVAPDENFFKSEVKK